MTKREGRTLRSTLFTTHEKSRGKKRRASINPSPSLRATAFPVAVTVDKTTLISGCRSFIIFRSGITAFVSPTDTAWNQITFPS